MARRLINSLLTAFQTLSHCVIPITSGMDTETERGAGRGILDLKDKIDE
jgi:hypothetical protein